jgi:hypothetical protein
MKTSRILIAAIIGSSILSMTKAEEIEELNTFYFGNSFLANTVPNFHPVLGQSAGKKWAADALIHPGVPILVHAFRQDDPNHRNCEIFNREGPTTDAIVMLQFGGPGLNYVTSEIWGGRVVFDPPRDIGDIASCASIIRKYQKMNPEGRAYVYTAWPNGSELREFSDRVKQEVLASLDGSELERGQVMKKFIKTEVNPRVKARLSEEVEPVLEGVDFEELWLAEDYIPSTSVPMEARERYLTYGQLLGSHRNDDAWEPTFEAFAAAAGVTPETVQEDLALIHVDLEALKAAEEPWNTFYGFAQKWPHTHSRPHNYALLEGLKKEFTKMWAEGRLGMIPVGDVMLALHRKIRDGAMPPLKSVQQFSEGHMRSGLPRYMLGATFYAVLFKEHPKNLDASVYADRENYIHDVNGLNKPLGGKHYVHIPDLGRHIPITPERKEVVDDTIWEVVKGHPYTQVK